MYTNQKQLVDLQLKLASAQNEVKKTIHNMDLENRLLSIQAKLAVETTKTKLHQCAALFENTAEQVVQSALYVNTFAEEIAHAVLYENTLANQAAASLYESTLAKQAMLNSWIDHGLQAIEAMAAGPLPNLFDRSALKMLELAEENAKKIDLLAGLIPTDTSWSPVEAFMESIGVLSIGDVSAIGYASVGNFFSIFVEGNEAKILREKIKFYREVLAQGLSLLVRIRTHAKPDEEILLMHRPSLERGDHLPRAWITKPAAKEAVSDRLFYF